MSATNQRRASTETAGPPAGHVSPPSAGVRPPLCRALVALCSVLCGLSSLLAGCNPFAPTLEDGDPFDDLLGNPRTVEGFFTNFRAAYELRDLSLYEPLLDSNFVFIYYDYDAQVERQWGFAQELASTGRLFEGTSLIQLRWNQILLQDLPSPALQARIVRSFNLTVTLGGGDVLRTDGNVNFLLARPDTTAPWKLLRWRDESEL